MEVPLDITIPPPEIRTLIGKTAIYVNKNGTAFENKIKSKESNNPKFIFLNDKDPYHAYYQFVLGVVKRTGKPPIITQGNEQLLKKEIAEGTQNENGVKENVQKPEDYKFLQFENHKLMYPEEKISSLDLSVIKLVAQFAVVNGEKVMNDFKENALNNSRLSSQFQFLNERHSMNKIFQKYFNIYNLLWTQKRELIDYYGKDTSNENLLDKCFARAEYLEKVSANVKEYEEKKLMERITYGSIDWQDFEIVETILFTELDEVAELNVPLVKSDLEYRSLIQKGKSNIFAQIEESTRLRDQLDNFENENVAQEEVADPTTKEEEDVPQYEEEEDSEKEDEETKNSEPVQETKPSKRVPKGIKVKSAGESRLMKRRYQADQKTMFDPVTKEKLLRCPLTDKLIPESKFQAHISTLLRDPNYEEEKARYEAKFKYGSNLSTQQVYENIQRLVEDKNKRQKHS